MKGHAFCIQLFSHVMLGPTESNAPHNIINKVIDQKDKVFHELVNKILIGLAKVLLK